MSNGRHSWVRFFPSDWIAGTSGMPPTQRLVYFEVCCRVWDKARPIPADELPEVLDGIDEWQGAVQKLVAKGKLIRNDDGSVFNRRALNEAQIAIARWQQKSQAGKLGAERRWRESPSESATPPDSTANGVGNCSAIDLPMQNQNQNQNQKIDGPAAKSRESGFTGQVIRLSSTEMDQFERMYPNIDLEAQLQRSDDWFVHHDRQHGANWTPRLKARLAKLNDSLDPSKHHQPGLMPYRPGVDL